MANDPDDNKGAVEQDRPDQPTNTTMAGQNPHRGKGQALEGRDTDMPEPGENEEHSMEGTFKKSPEGELNDHDQREDPLAS